MKVRQFCKNWEEIGENEGSVSKLQGVCAWWFECMCAFEGGEREGVCVWGRCVCERESLFVGVFISVFISFESVCVSAKMRVWGDGEKEGFCVYVRMVKICVCACEGDRTREINKEREREREREYVCVCVWVSKKR